MLLSPRTPRNLCCLSEPSPCPWRRPQGLGDVYRRDPLVWRTMLTELNANHTTDQQQKHLHMTWICHINVQKCYDMAPYHMSCHMRVYTITGLLLNISTESLVIALITYSHIVRNQMVDVTGGFL